jgi:hypothetical protein
MMKDSLEDYIPYNAQSLLDSPSPKIRQLVREYVALSTKQSPTEADSDRLAAILQLAESDDKWHWMQSLVAKSGYSIQRPMPTMNASMSY